ncbi:hypothetical protein AB1Y20_000611 [Prymnesium parvum]|uniref:Calponin-homology (CH) domain-containing protein n=1 Tax=Prymnesium parvum TaxID=97485 RepID=A0AB34K6B8_PRYPA
MEQEARQWIEDCLNDTTLFHAGFPEGLRDGRVLCNLVNFIKPGILPPPSTSSTAFKQMENIASYLRACAVLGVPNHELFQTVDLFEAKNIKAVLTNIHALGRAAQTLSEYRGPVLGAKLATANSRDFSDRHDSYLNKAGSGINATSPTKVAEAHLWPMEQAELTLLQMLAAAAQAAVKKFRVQKNKAKEATSEAERRNDAAKEARAAFAKAEATEVAAQTADAKAAAEAKTLAAKAEAEKAEKAALEAAAQATQARKDAAAAEKAAALAVAAEAAALAEATAHQPDNTTPPPPSEAAAMFESLRADGAAAMAGASPVSDALAGYSEPPSAKELSEKDESISQLQAELRTARAALKEKELELEASAMREASLRQMIKLALAETIPPRTTVTGASFTHTQS